MEDMKNVLEEVEQNLNVFSKRFPQEMEAFMKLMGAIERPKALDLKHKALIAIALSISRHCKWCIAYHVKEALGHGATREEVEEASWMAVLMTGGPGLMYMQLVEKALDDFKEK